MRYPSLSGKTNLRTPLQKRADEFDMDLYRLISRAEQNADTLDHKEKAAWTEALIYLRRTRALVRGMMHEDDRKATG